MKKFFRKNQKTAILIVKYGTILSGVIYILLTPPPIDSFSNSSLIKAFVIFLMAFLIIPMVMYKKKRHLKSWLISAIIAFIAFISIGAYYFYFKDKYVIHYADADIVIGNKISPNSLPKILQLSKEENEILDNGSKFSNKKLLSYAGGNPEKIWTFQSIQKNKLWLIILFYSCITVVVCLILFLLQSLEITFDK